MTDTSNSKRDVCQHLQFRDIIDFVISDITLVLVTLVADKKFLTTRMCSSDVQTVGFGQCYWSVNVVLFKSVGVQSINNVSSN